MKELVGATPPPALQAKTRLGQTPLYLAAYWVRAMPPCFRHDRYTAAVQACRNIHYEDVLWKMGTDLADSRQYLSPQFSWRGRRRGGGGACCVVARILLLFRFATGWLLKLSAACLHGYGGGYHTVLSHPLVRWRATPL